MGFRLVSPPFASWNLPSLPDRPPMKIGDTAQVIISYAFDPGRFYVQFVSERQAIATLTDKMTKYYVAPGSGDSEHLTEEPQIGLLVAAPYQSMASMFRAQVIGYGTARGQVIINYPEYGNDCEIRASQMRKLQPLFKKEPPYSLKCALYGMKATNMWSPGEIKFFKDLFFHETFGKELTMRIAGVENGVHLVEFLDGETNLVETYRTLLVNSGMPQPPPISRPLQNQMDQRERQAPPTAVRNFKATVPITETPIPPHRAAAAATCASPTKVELKPYHPEILVDQRLKCQLTFATSPDDFYVRLVSPHDSDNVEFSDALRKIMSDMQVHYSNVSPELSLQPLCVGSIVAASSLDKRFYRAKVLSMPMDGEDVVKVQAMDYGNVELVPKRQVFPLLPEFAQGLDALAVHCALKGIKPNNDRNEWTQDALSFFQSYKGRTLSVVVHGPSRRFPGRADVELVEVAAFGRVPLAPVAVIGSLEMAGHCVRIDDDDASRIPVTRSQTPEPQNVQPVPYPRSLLPRGLKDDEVAVIDMTNPNEFMAQFSGFQLQLRLVTEALHKYYGDAVRKPPPIERPAPAGMRCVAKYRADGCWYRAEVITDQGDDGAIRVQFVDYGNVDDVDPEEVCVLLESVPYISDTPVLAFKMRIAGVRFDMNNWADWQENIQKAVSSCVIEVLDVDEESMLYTVALTKRNNPTRDMSTWLIENDVASVEHPDTASDIPVQGSYLHVRGLPKLFIPAGTGDFLDVVVAYVTEQKTIFVQLEHRAEELLRLANQLTSVYSSLPNNELINPRRGQMCAAKYALDGLWYRGCVIERGDPNTVKVMFVDYGNTEVISKHDVKKLDEDLQKSAPYAIELAFTIPMDGVPHQELASKLENKNLVVKIESEIPAPVEGVVLKASFFEVDVNKRTWIDVGEVLAGQYNVAVGASSRTGQQPIVYKVTPNTAKRFLDFK